MTAKDVYQPGAPRVIDKNTFIDQTTFNHVRPQADRTAAQKHTDEAFDHATDSADRAINGFADSLEWATSIGIEIPSRIKGVVTILGQWQKHLEDERKRRG